MREEDVKVGARVLYDYCSTPATIRSIKMMDNDPNMIQSFTVHYDDNTFDREYSYETPSEFVLIEPDSIKFKVPVKEKYSNRTIKIIENGGTIVLKSKSGKMYLHHHTNIAAGKDAAHWCYDKHQALEIYTLEWAFAIAPLYDCKVVVVYHKKKV